jgi:hypothetical protein
MGADKNYESHVQENGTVIQNRAIPNAGTNPGEYSDILKFSNCTGIVVDGCEIFGGKEDCIDAVRGELYTFKNNTLHPVHNGITLKGSINTIVIDNVKFETHGKDCDIELGQYDNYWYVGRKPTRDITINNVNAEDGKPIVIKVWDAETPKVTNSNVKIVKIPKLIWFPYFVFRAIQTRGIKNVCKPVDSNAFIKTK